MNYRKCTTTQKGEPRNSVHWYLRNAKLRKFFSFWLAKPLYASSHVSQTKKNFFFHLRNAKLRKTQMEGKVFDLEVSRFKMWLCQHASQDVHTAITSYQESKDNTTPRDAFIESFRQFLEVHIESDLETAIDVLSQYCTYTNRPCCKESAVDIVTTF
jgi:triacylglycerol esterase/lipase EstA (alpha/beta hydrolase family)